MKELYLISKGQPKVPLEAEVIKPDSLAGLSTEEIANLIIYRGNRRVRLGEYFEVKGESADNPEELRVIVEGDVSRTKYIGAEMSAGELIVNGSPYMYLGAWMSGGKIVVNGNVGDFAALEMSGGELVINGNAGNYLGAAYRGNWRGMSDGLIVVKGNAGAEIGSWMMGGKIVVEGSTGPFTGVHMSDGIIVVYGELGPRAGAQMTWGSIVVYGYAPELLPSFSFNEVIPAVEIEEERFEGPFIEYVGDLAEEGEGSIYLLEEKNKHLKPQ